MQYNILRVLFQFLTDIASTAVIFKIIPVWPPHIINFTVALYGECHGNVNYLQMATVKCSMVTTTVYHAPQYSNLSKKSKIIFFIYNGS